MDLHTFLHSEGKQRHDSILYRRLALLPGLCSDPSSSSSCAVDAQAATAAVLKGPPPAPPLLDDAAFRPPPSAHLHRVHPQHDGPPLPTPPRHPHRPSSSSAASAAASPGSLRAAVQRSTRGRAERVQRREGDGEGGGGGDSAGGALSGFGTLGRVARVLKRKRGGQDGVCYRGEDGAGGRGAEGEGDEYDEEKRAAAMASGFAELHAAISATIGTIAAATGQDLGRCFDLLSSHIKGYTHDADAEALRVSLEKLAARSGDDRPGGARVALCMLDHAFLLVGNLHPALRSVLRWCRDRLAGCLYCERGCIAPGDVGLSDGRMEASRALYTGPPPPPPPGAAGDAEAAAVAAAAASEDAEAAAVRLLERYSGRLACEDNRELQGRQRAAHDVIREERALTQRRLHAEQSVSEYWQRTVRGVLFMAWRRVLGDEREARLAGEDRLLLERDVSLAKRAAAEQARERVRVEATLYEQVTQVEQKLLASATSLKVSDDAVLAAAAAAKQQKTRMVQLRAEQVLLRDRMRRALARQEQAEREEAALRAALASAQAAAAEATESRESHEALRAACVSYVRRVRFSEAMLRVRGGVGTLARWYTALLHAGGGGGGGGRHWVDGLARGLRATFPSEVSSADADRVVKEGDDLKKAELAVALLRRLLGGGVPVHRNALVPPIQQDTAMGVVVMLATRACAPAPPAKDGGVEGGGEGGEEEEEDLAAKMRRVETATVHAFDTLAGVAGDLLRWPTSQQEAVLVAPHVSPAEWAPAAGLPEGAPKVVRVMAKHGKLEPVLERVRSSAVGLACLRAHYSPVYLVSTSVQAMLHDAGVRPEAEAEVMGFLPTDGRVEVSPHSFAMCLVAGALKQFPGTPAADAFDRLLREVLYPRCRIRGVRGGVADVLVRHRDAARAAYAEIAGGGGGGGGGNGAGGTIGHSGLAAFLEARGAVVPAVPGSPGGGGGGGGGGGSDPEGRSPAPAAAAAAGRVAVSAKQFREMFDACLAPELGGKAARADTVVRFPQFLSLLQLVSEAVYPNPTVPAHERLGRFFTEVLQFSTPQETKKEPEKKQQQQQKR